MRYWAFLSYSHQDEAWAQWLHKALETYRVPRRLVGRALGADTIPRRLFPIFRDRDELPSSAELGAVINRALRASRNLIVICSPRAATSRWVNEEIRTFRQLGRSGRIFCLIVDGEPNASQIPDLAYIECFPPALREPGPDGAHFEPIAADARNRKDGKANAKLKLISGLLEVGLDELKQREKQRQLWQGVQAAALALAVVAALAGTWQWFTQQRAAREREILVEKLVENGRQELLEGRHARAAVFLNAAYGMGQDDVPLRFMLGQAMRTVDSVTNVRVQHGGGPVRKAAFSPDGTRFVLVVELEKETVAKIYDAATGAGIAVLSDVQPAPRIVQFLGNERLLITGYATPVETFKEESPSTRVWDLSSPAPRFAWAGFNGRFGLPVHPQGSRVLIASTAPTGGLEIRNLETGELAGTLAQGRAVVSASYSPDGASIVMSDDAGGVELWSTQTNSRVRALTTVGPERYTSVLFTPGGDRVIGTTKDGDLRIWDPEDGTLKLAFAADRDRITELEFDAKGRRMLTVGAQGYRVWYVPRGSIVFTLATPLFPGASGALSPDGDFVVTADNGTNTAQVWDVQAKRQLRVLDLHTNVVSSVAFDASGQRLLVASRDGAAGIWNTQVNPAWRKATIPEDAASVRFDQAGERVIAGYGSGTSGRTVILDSASGAQLGTVGSHGGKVLWIDRSPDGARLATASEDGTAAIWRFPDGQPLGQMDHGKVAVRYASFSPDGKRLVTTMDHRASGSTRAGLWDGENGSFISWLDHDGVVVRAAFDPDGTHIATASYDGSVKIWKASSGSLLKTFSDYGAPVISVTYSANGQQLLTAAWNNTVRIRHASSGDLIAALDNPSLGQPNQAVWSPDEKTVAIASYAGNVWLWNPQTGSLATLGLHKESVLGVRFLHDGAIVLSWGIDGVVRSWTPQGEALGAIAAHSKDLRPPAVDPAEGQLATVAEDYRVAVWNISLEERSHSAINQALACGVPWTLNEQTLIQSEPDTRSCTRNAAAPQ